MSTRTTGAPAQSDGIVEKRRAARIAASLVPSIAGLRLSPCGGKASLLNLSATGAAVKTDTKLVLGTKVTVHLDGTFVPASIRGQVVRCGVTAIDSGSIWYQIGIAFDDSISIEPSLIAPTQSAPTPPSPQAAQAGPWNRW